MSSIATLPYAGNVFIQYRFSRSLSLTDVGKTFGIQGSTWAAWEQGISAPDSVEVIASRMGISSDHLLSSVKFIKSRKEYLDNMSKNK